MSNLFWLTEAQRERLKPFFPRSHGVPRVDDRRVLSGIIFVNRNGLRWRVVDLCAWILTEFQLVVTRQTLSRELRRMGYRKLSARPRHHAQATGAVEDFKKPSRHGLRV